MAEGAQVPDRLLVSSPLYAEHCSGTFHRIDEQANSFPIWESGDQRHWLFSTRAGGWIITDDKGSLYAAESSGLIASVGKHRGRMPHRIAQWQVGDGDGWHVDPSIAVALVPPFSPKRTAIVDSPARPQGLGLSASEAEERLRIATSQIDTLLTQCELLRADRKALQEKFDDSEADLRLLISQNEHLQRRAAEAEGRTASAQRSGHSAERVREMEQRIELLTSQYSREQASLREERQRRAELETSRRGLEVEGAQLRHALAEAQAEASGLSSAEARVAVLQKDLALQQEHSASLCSDLSAAQAAADAAASQQQCDAENSRLTLHSAERENERLRRELDELRLVPLTLAESERELRTTLQRLTAAETEVAALKRAQMVVSRGAGPSPGRRAASTTPPLALRQHPASPALQALDAVEVVTQPPAALPRHASPTLQAGPAAAADDILVHPLERTLESPPHPGSLPLPQHLQEDVVMVAAPPGALQMPMPLPLSPPQAGGGGGGPRMSPIRVDENLNIVGGGAARVGVGVGCTGFSPRRTPNRQRPEGGGGVGGAGVAKAEHSRVCSPPRKRSPLPPVRAGVSTAAPPGQAALSTRFMFPGMPQAHAGHAMPHGGHQATPGAWGGEEAPHHQHQRVVAGVQLVPALQRSRNAGGRPTVVRHSRTHSPPQPVGEQPQPQGHRQGRLWVMCPAVQAMEGLYHIQDPHAPTPTWASGHDRWILINIDTSGDMRWYLTTGDGDGFSTALARVKEGRAMARSEPCVSLSAMPNVLKTWERNAGGSWVVDPSIRVTHAAAIGE